MVSIHDYEMRTESPPKYCEYSTLERPISSKSPIRTAPIPINNKEMQPGSDAHGLPLPHEMMNFIEARSNVADKNACQPMVYTPSIELNKFSAHNQQHNENLTSSPNDVEKVGINWHCCPNCNRRRRASHRRCRRVLVWTQFAMIVAIFIFVVVLIGVTIYAALMIQDAINQADYAIRNNAVTSVAGRVKALFNRIRPKGRADGKMVEVDVS